MQEVRVWNRGGGGRHCTERRLSSEAACSYLYMQSNFQIEFLAQTFSEMSQLCLWKAKSFL